MSIFRDAIYFITVTHGGLFGSDEMHQCELPCLQDFSNFCCQLAAMPNLMGLNISFTLCVPLLHTVYPPFRGLQFMGFPHLPVNEPKSITSVLNFPHFKLSSVLFLDPYIKSYIGVSLKHSFLCNPHYTICN
jgi:hypothetical protein